jgi:hypothetical protein
LAPFGVGGFHRRDEPDAHRHLKPQADLHGHAHPDRNSYTYTHADLNPHATPYCHAYPDRNSYAYAHADRQPHADLYAHPTYTPTRTPTPTPTPTPTLTPTLTPTARRGYSLRFYGNGFRAPDRDRVKIKIDGPARPADVGATDFTLEWWMKALPGENASQAVACNQNDGWIYGNIVFDRDVFGGGDYGDYGIALTGGRVAFGLSVGNAGTTLCGTSVVADGAWHHVAVTRRRADGLMRLFVDGRLEASADGADGNASYRDGRATAYPNDPYLVIGAEKHDAGASYPSYSGWIDEVRLSNVLRYTIPFTRPTQPFTPDAATVALYHFDEGSGDTVHDSSGAPGGPSDGVRRYGGSPAGPVWSTDTPFP